MKQTFHVHNHYWGPITGRYFSSKTQTTVPTDDPALVAWLAKGNASTPHPGDAALREVLAPYSIGLTPQETRNLEAFQSIASNPHLLARALYRLLQEQEALELLKTTEQTHPLTGADMSAARHQDYITLARDRTKSLWQAYLDLKEMQSEWSALDYGTTLSDGAGANLGYNKAHVGSVVFDTVNALTTLFNTGHATNLSSLL